MEISTEQQLQFSELNVQMGGANEIRKHRVRQKIDEQSPQRCSKKSCDWGLRGKVAQHFDELLMQNLWTPTENVVRLINAAFC